MHSTGDRCGMAQHGGGIVFPSGIDPDIACELPRALRMMVELSRQDVPELPALGHGVQASGDHIEVARAIVTRTRVALRGACALEVESDRPIGHPLSQDVLAFDPERAASLEAKLDVGCPFLVEIPTVSDAGKRVEVPPEMMLGNPSADGHLQAARSGDEIEYLPLREVEFAGKRVQGRWGRDRDQVGIGIGGDRNGRRSEFLGEEMAMPLVLAERVALKVAQQGSGVPPTRTRPARPRQLGGRAPKRINPGLIAGRLPSLNSTEMAFGGLWSTGSADEEAESG